MKRKHIFIMTLTSLLWLSACSNQTTEKIDSNSQQDSREETNQPKNSEMNESEKSNDSQSDEKAPESEESNEKTATQSDVLQSVKQQIKTNLSIKLPTKFPLEKNHHLTAVTKSKDDSYEVTFYESVDSIPVNDINRISKGDVKKIAKVAAAQYPSEKEAKSTINYQRLQTASPKIDLGFGIAGYKDAGAGSAFTSWHEGRWSFVVRNRNDEQGNIAGLKTAKTIVNKLEKQVLPIPHEVGAGAFDTSAINSIEANRLTWQEKNVVYVVMMGDPFELIDTVTQHLDK